MVRTRPPDPNAPEVLEIRFQSKHPNEAPRLGKHRGDEQYQADGNVPSR